MTRLVVPVNKLADLPQPAPVPPATMQCPKEKYWDKLLNACMSCKFTWCQPPKFKQCVDYCSSQDCSKRGGFYYDHLLRKCINCSAICGQHPQECQSFCRSLSDFPVATLPMPAALQSAQCKLDGTCDQQLVVYMVLGLCLCVLLFSLLLMWLYFRKQEEVGACQPSPVTCHKMRNSPKDRLVEAGSVGSGSSGSQTPEPVETCGFCFPEQSPAVQETRAGYRTYQLGAQGEADMAGIPGSGSAGTIPTPEDSHFQIICSPSQEKMQMA
ncbi:tumor necrosis factor receptor superfamily member 13B [Tiliqua scincoides]|uniref:tumor necrosis factor receptor superfamily member 13B n=1 Tax=Tiliqua scincoides TaxID=71010 RepID=UPI0034630F83